MNIYFVGAPTQAKGLDDFGIIASRFTDHSFFWYCHSVSGELKKRYPFTHFVTGLDDEKLRKKIKEEMDIFISCSRFEGFCLPIAEAIMLKKRVLTYDLEEVKSEFKNHILYVRQFEINQYIQQIEKIMSNPLSNESLIRSREYVAANFAPEKISERLIEIILKNP